MRGRLFAAACAAALVGSIPSVANATHSGGSAPYQDFVTGGGISSFETHFGFTAHKRDARVSGHATFKNFTGLTADRRGPVTCLRVRGNRAVFGVEDRQKGGPPEFREFFVQDNGEPSEMPDFLNQVGPPTNTPPPPDCRTDPNTQAPIFPISSGNIQVHDGASP
jgi:hypothetical protein